MLMSQKALDEVMAASKAMMAARKSIVVFSKFGTPKRNAESGESHRTEDI
jgi:hypothetical protein